MKDKFELTDVLESLFPSYEEFSQEMDDHDWLMSEDEANESADRIVTSALSNRPPRDGSTLDDIETVAGLCFRGSDGAPGVVTPEILDALREWVHYKWHVRVSAGVLPIVPMNSGKKSEPRAGWTANSVQEILDWLLEVGRALGIKNIRYYPLSRDRKSGYGLASYASVGHDHETSRRLSVGQITKFLNQSPLEGHDSFWSLTLGVPTLFVIDESCSAGVECFIGNEVVPLLRAKRNNCMNVLARHNSDGWLDCPLFGATGLTGKLSCDFVVPTSVFDNIRANFWEDLSEQALQFYRAVQMVASRLEILYREELDCAGPDRSEVGREILETCDTLPTLYQYCVQQIARRLNCRFGSILLRVTDSLGANLLVLKKTTYSPSERFEGTKGGTYCWDEDALTTWVARTGRSVCLQDLGGSMLRDKLREYDSTLVWQNKVPDSDNHGDLLIVPVIYKNRVIAVLRYTTRNDGHFTEHDQRWLEHVARKYIGPKLECCARRAADELRDSHRDAIAAISVRDVVVPWNETAREIAEQLKDVAGRVFSFEGGRKTILVNVIDKDGEHFSHHAIINSMRAELENRYRVEGSLTGFAVKERGVVFLADLEKAERKCAYRKVIRDAVCAMACRIGPASRPMGAMVVLSDRYDLSPEIHGEALKMMSDVAGEILFRNVLKSILGQRNNRTAGIRAALQQLEGVLVRQHHEFQLQPEAIREQQSCLSLLERMIAGLEPECSAEKSLDEPFEEFGVKSAVELAASLANTDPERGVMECRLDQNLKVVGKHGFVVAILFDLFRHAWQFSTKVSVHAARRRSELGVSWLDLNVECVGPPRSRAELSSTFDTKILEVLQVQVDTLGLRDSLLRARSYRLPDGRSGDLCVEVPEGDVPYRCTFQIPIVSEMPAVSLS